MIATMDVLKNPSKEAMESIMPPQGPHSQRSFQAYEYQYSILFFDSFPSGRYKRLQWLLAPKLGQGR